MTYHSKLIDGDSAQYQRLGRKDFFKFSHRCNFIPNWNPIAQPASCNTPLELMVPRKDLDRPRVPSPVECQI